MASFQILMVVSAAWMKLCALLQTVQSCVLQRFAQDTKAHLQEMFTQRSLITELDWGNITES